MESCCRAPACLPRQCATVSEWYDTLRLGEAQGVRVGAVVAGVVTPLAVVAVFVGGAVPDCVSWLNLFAEAAAVGEWSGFGCAASWCVFVVVLWHGVPPYVSLASVFDSRGQSDATSLQGLWSVTVGNESSVVEIWVNM